MRIVSVVGGRPNFVKIAPIIEAFVSAGRDKPLLVHTGQHYDYAMSESFFEELAIPAPDHFLGVGSGTHAAQTAGVMLAFEPIVTSVRPDLVLVVGDLNSTLAAALVAAKCGVRVAHVEAGLRSFDRSMPEEINRILTDHMSDYLFTHSRDADANLRHEGIAAEKIHLVGNVMIDTLLKYRQSAQRRQAATTLGLVPGAYGVLTVHRPSNVDDPERFREIAEGLRNVVAQVPVIFPVHPRTRRRIEEFGMREVLEPVRELRLVEPMSYLNFLSLLMDARLVLTDSGGIQEEATALGVPCLTLRDNTERPVTVTAGTNVVVGTNRERIAREVARVLCNGAPKRDMPELWDGHAAYRIVQVLTRNGR